ncbi:MAG TPA: fimbria/pilus outer membrane usher protein [Candidatus Methanoperedens sp.]|nr:fimbria/pilus outer membrane usher protein [Candidatus Methanoperedens sp.]
MSIIRSWGRSGLLAALPGCLLLLVFAPGRAAALDELLLGVRLNTVDQGAFFAYRTAEGDLLFAEEDLRAMGFRTLPATPQVIDGKAHHSLRALGVSYDFNADAVSADISAPPELLASAVIDFLAGTSRDVEYPSGRSAFLNYGLAWRGGEGYGSPGLEATAELGARAGDWQLLSDALYRSFAEAGDVIRLMSRASWEDRSEQQRLTIGDVTANPGELWAAPLLGGLSCTKLHRLDPYRVRHPTFGLTGQASLPAEARIYLDGVQVRTEKLAPGRFEILNLDAYGGSRSVEVVVQDALGRETRIRRPFYFTDAVLRRGLHEYGYHLGWLRQDFGVASNHYARPVVSVFHRYGISDSFTLGFAGEAGNGAASVGPTLSFVAESLGTVTASLSAGRMDGEGGYAWAVAHEYHTPRWNAHVRCLRASGRYRTMLDADAAALAGTHLDAGIGFGTAGVGNVAVDWSSRRLDAGADRNRLGVDYHLGLFGKLRLLAGVARIEEEGERRTEFSLGLSYFPGRERTIAGQYSRLGGESLATLEIAQDRREGTGLAWRGSAQWRGDETLLRPALEYRGRHGILAGNVALRREGDERFRGSYDLSAAGALYATGGHVGLGRPVSDSFAIVQVGREKGLPGVRVYQGGSERGATAADGTLLLPEVGSYVHNQISIEPKDIPLDYSLEQIMRVISPAERSGSVVLFNAARYQAVTGRLAVTEHGARRPIEYLEISVRAGKRAWSMPSGKDGEFFLENAGSGAVFLSFRDRGAERSCAIVIPPSEEVIVDIGEVHCEIAP